MYYRAAPATCLVLRTIDTLGASKSFNSAILETASGFGFPGLAVRFQAEALSFRVRGVLCSGYQGFQGFGFGDSSGKL